jgi:hypothetical protein
VAHAEHRPGRSHGAHASKRKKVAHVVPIHGSRELTHSAAAALPSRIIEQLRVDQLAIPGLAFMVEDDTGTTGENS